ncbi:S24/S26 family peptidase [Plebeiibacterium marinum]|uniref:S24/S26 family peptidase n=1 Tax=Plebeiibacterium marinum TaxID=2992111 RepID=A0AAE3MDU8_9BACT|nr:S24/S26 family peptidase [Plebeiobacterium marinum]MCW3805978.1 S24/S26 family peptidase [Plebeiobacterium marinum]
MKDSRLENISYTFIELLNTGKEVDIPVYGMSMFPFFLPGDTVRVKKVAVQDLIKGDVVVFRGSLRLVAHRLLSWDKNNRRLFCKGDGLIYKDRPVVFNDYCGKVILHFRKGRVMESSNLGKRLIAYVSPFTGIVFFILGRIWYRFFK